ncbi:hypothetical protein AGENTSMITH_19 [Bacillus phage vB_BspM_AgentSmith]|nr:hypothetical protein AGENTSMITH_19 [Bacillus phage vB_BspM_AgentSmith]
MINKASAQIATNLGTILAEKELKIVPKSGTLLSNLTASIQANLYSGSNSVEMIPEMIEMAAGGVIRNSSYTASEHDSYMDNLIEDLSKLVSSYISMIRGTVNPVVTKFTDRLVDVMNQHKYRAAEEFFNIEYFKPHTVFTTPLVTSEVKGYDNFTKSTFKEHLNLEIIRGEEFGLLDYLMTGDHSQDLEIRNWFSGVENLAKSYITDDVPEYTMSVRNLLSYGLLNYLFYRNLAEKTDIETGDSITELRNKAASNRDYYGRQLATSIGYYEKAIRTGKLLSSVSDNTFSYMGNDSVDLVIYEDSFASFAKDGGDIEVLFGYLATNQPTLYLESSALLKQADFYREKWNITRNSYLMFLNNSKLNSFKNLLTQVFDSSLLETVEHEAMQKHITSDPGYLEKTRQLGYAFIDDLDVSDMDNLDKIVLVLVAKIRFRFTNAYLLLRDMQECMAMSEDMTPMEASLYASVRYVTDYMLEQADLVTG